MKTLSRGYAEFGKSFDWEQYWETMSNGGLGGPKSRKMIYVKVCAKSFIKNVLTEAPLKNFLIDLK